MEDLRALKGVVIDAGHGGIDSGASGNGIVEKNLTLDISKYMYDRLRELGIPVKMTRTTDEALNSITRPKRVKESFGDSKDVIVISNHINAGGSEGAEVIYSLRNSDTFSQIILNNLAKKGQIIRKAYQRRLPSNPSKDYFYILRETPNNESVIVEYGFLDNSRDAIKLKNNYKEYAEAVIKAIFDYKGLTYISPKDKVVDNSNDTYTVKSGDTLWTIAKNNNLTVNELKSLNNLTSNLLSVGQVLIIKKNSNSNKNSYVVKPGDTLYSISNKYNISVDDLKESNNLTNNTLSIGQLLIIPNKEQYKVYTVKSGDTLYRIAIIFGTTVDKLKVINNLNSNTLNVGQKLLIP